MRKKFMALLLIATITAMALVGCGSSTSTSSSGDSSTKTYKVAMIADTSIADGGWGAACYNAMVSAAAEYGFETQYTDGLSTADFASSIRSYCDLGFDLIFAPGNQYTDAVVEVAADYPNVKFALLNGTVETDNIESLLPDAEQIGYMAGALAGLMTTTNNIGFVGGMELDTTKAKLANYTAAAQKVNPDVKVQAAYAASFSDAAKGKEIANSMVSINNVDVMFGDASAVDSGVREAFNAMDNKYDIAQPSDLLATQTSKSVIGSVVTDNATMIKLCMDDVINNTYGNKTIEGNLANGCLSVGTFSSDVPASIQEEYLQIVEQIKDGTFITD